MKILSCVYIAVMCLLMLADSAHAISVSDGRKQIEQAAEEASAIYSTDDLNYDCIKCAEDEKGSECIYCDGLLTGASTVLGMLEYEKSFCPPNDLDTRMVRNAYRRWYIDTSKTNRTMKNWHAVQGVVQAMKDSFPCGG